MQTLVCEGEIATTATSTNLSDFVCLDDLGQQISFNIVDTSIFQNFILPSLSLEQGQLIAFGILEIWALAFLGRILGKVITERYSNQS